MADVIDAATLRSLIDYNPDTGEFTWKPRPERSHYDRTWNTRYANAQAGATGRRANCEYRSISINGRRYQAHRLAFLHVTGGWPIGDIDHKDGNGTNNCWSNLRPATRTLNNANVGCRSRNTSGFKGVTVISKGSSPRYLAKIAARGKHYNLGSFGTPEEAHSAYMRAATEHFGEFARGV